MTTTLDKIEARAQAVSDQGSYDDFIEALNVSQKDVPLLCRALRIAADEVIASLGIPDSSSIQESIDFAIDKWLQEAQDDQSDV